MELFRGKGKPEMQQFLKNRKLLVLLGVLGLVLLFNPLTWFKGQDNTPLAPAARSDNTVATGAGDELSQYEAMMEKKMSDILDAINGVSDAKVLITLDSGSTTVFAEDTQKNTQNTTEKDQSGGTRTTTQVDQTGKIVLVDKNGTNQPLVEQIIRPKVRGVLVVAKGAESIRIQALIMDAVERALDVPFHRISIQPEKQQP